MLRPGRWIAVSLPGVLCALGLGASACATTEARTNPAPLAVPAPPPRLVLPAPIDPVQTDIDLPSPEAVTLPPPSASKPRESAPAPKPADKPVAPPAATPPPETTSSVLQTTSNVGEVEQRAKDLIANANRDLGHVDVRTLGNDARSQYDQARKFVSLAQDALGHRNFVYARELAEKAAALAGQLPKTHPLVSDPTTL